MVRRSTSSLASRQLDPKKQAKRQAVNAHAAFRPQAQLLRRVEQLPTSQGCHAADQIPAVGRCAQECDPVSTVSKKCLRRSVMGAILLPVIFCKRVINFQSLLRQEMPA